ncbi:6-bladed beta-propeller [candidate division KSB1 bacterium]
MKKLALVFVCVISICLVIVGLFIHNWDDQAVFKEDVQNVLFDYSIKDFITFDKEFNDESLNKPLFIRTNPVTNEIIILDRGNQCLYCFNTAGEFIRKIGRNGQGPGEFKSPSVLDIDENGNIYVYDFGNHRLTYFEKHGEYLGDFRYRGTGYTSFSVAPNGNILFNNVMQIRENSDYYIQEYNIAGEMLNKIGKIPEDLSDIMLAVGTPFMDEINNYYMFMRYDALALKINKDNETIKISGLDNIDTIDRMKDHERYNEPDRVGDWIFYDDIIFRNNIFFVLTDDHLYLNPISLFISALNTELSVIDKTEIKTEFEIGRSFFLRERPKFTFSMDGNIIVPLPEKSVVIELFVQN